MSGEKNSFDNFEELYTNCYWLVYRYVRHMVEKDLAAAEDVTQEVFLVAYQKWQEVRRHPNQKGFLLLTAKNKLKKLQQKKEYKIEVLSLETGQKLYSRKVRNDQFSRNGKLVIRLPEILKDTSKGYVIRLHHYGKNYTMIPKVSRFPELDPYPYGSLYINGKKTFYDLSMSILQKKSES